LKDWDPADMMGLQSEAKPRAKEALQNGVLALAELQDMLYAQDKWAVLVIFQAMDAAVVLQVSTADKLVAERLWCVLRRPSRKGCR
jgi:hypothetical protein